jgi:hypothetical protein
MIMLSWNCRGFGNPQTVLDLHQMVKEKKLRFMFLMETLCTKTYVDRLRIRLGFESLFTVDPIGRSGSLALFWKEDRELEIFNFSRSHINAVIKEEDDTHSWRFTGFYDHPNCSRRADS